MGCQLAKGAGVGTNKRAACRATAFRLGWQAGRQVAACSLLTGCLLAKGAGVGTNKRAACRATAFRLGWQAGQQVAACSLLMGCQLAKGAGVGTNKRAACRATAFCMRQPQQPFRPQGLGGQGRVGGEQSSEAELPFPGPALVGVGGWVRQARGLPRHRFLYAPTKVLKCAPTTDAHNIHDYRGVGGILGPW